VVIWAIDLKNGMELQPWAPCLDRLATTPQEATALLADAVAILQVRAAHLAATGRRVWDPTPDMPALLIIVDEYAELADDAPAAMSDADSVARPTSSKGHSAITEISLNSLIGWKGVCLRTLIVPRHTVLSQDFLSD
jgi:hypothetical protein